MIPAGLQPVSLWTRRAQSGGRWGGSFLALYGSLNYAADPAPTQTFFQEWWFGQTSPPPITPAFPTTFISHLIGR